MRVSSRPPRRHEMRHPRLKPLKPTSVIPFAACGRGAGCFRSRAIALRRPLEHEGWKTAPARHPSLVAREPVVPSRSCGPARSEIRYSTKPHFHSNWGRGPVLPVGVRLARRVRVEYRVYFGRNATMSAARRQFSRWGRGSAGMDRPSNAAGVSPPAVSPDFSYSASPWRSQRGRS